MTPRAFIPVVCTALALLAQLALLAPVPAWAQVRDVDLKAAYIYNFVQFTTWPELGRAREPFFVCASPDSALWASLQAFNGKPVNNRAWSTVDAGSRLKAGSCDVLVLARAADRPAPAQGTLVVRDGAGRGMAAITLVDGDEQIRFDINTDEATRSGLRFSSKLLRLARNVT
ncbi:YfiR family protein [Massilia sp. Dwa41.01b]|uniref:YfiR family protein n=1 Tax=Massilia sp. Dwa41.01b TaxID=2709302 RepID=UPI0016034B89|nr:YfiR family protein [Massilia sp. Dwa41.01b]QNA90008.1 YfiR family protein [Massilia sp. Dwa41.01b]